MTPAARVQSAIELLDAIIGATRDKGASADRVAAAFFAARRYAGSKDRRAIRDLVWRAIRSFGERPENGRAAMVALADRDDELAELFDGRPYGPAPIGAEEPRAAGDMLPDWVRPLFADLVAQDEYSALLERAPLDIRVNRLVASLAEVESQFPDARPIGGSADGLRLPTGTAVEASEAYRSGAIEVQDFGSQLISEACKAAPAMTVLDLCAGAGGKTLALAALMANRGSLYATDLDSRRLAPLHDRLARSGAGIVEVRIPRSRGHEPFADIAGQVDLVLVDAPCTGSGTWRRNPDAKWRVRPGALAERIKDQAEVLARAARLVKPGGRIAYITCSVLPEENDEAIRAFLGKHAGFSAVAPIDVLKGAESDFSLLARFGTAYGLQLSPRRTGTDGFYLACLTRDA